MAKISGHIDVQRLYAVLGDILSEKYDMKIRFTVTPKADRQAVAQGGTACSIE